MGDPLFDSRSKAPNGLSGGSLFSGNGFAQDPFARDPAIGSSVAPLFDGAFALPRNPATGPSSQAVTQIVPPARVILVSEPTQEPELSPAQVQTFMKSRIMEGENFVLNGKPGPTGSSNLRADLAEFAKQAKVLGELRAANPAITAAADEALLANLKLLSGYHRAIGAQFRIGDATQRSFEQARADMVGALSQNYAQQKQAWINSKIGDLETLLVPARPAPVPEAPPMVAPETTTPVKPSVAVLTATLYGLIAGKVKDPAEARTTLQSVNDLLKSPNLTDDDRRLVSQMVKQSAVLSHLLMRSTLSPNANYTEYRFFGQSGMADSLLQSELKKLAHDAELVAGISRADPTQSEAVSKLMVQNLRLLAKYETAIMSGKVTLVAADGTKTEVAATVSEETRGVFRDTRAQIIAAIPARYERFRNQILGMTTEELMRQLPESGEMQLNPNRYIHEVDDAVVDPDAEALVRQAQTASVSIKATGLDRDSNGDLHTRHGSGINISAEGLILTNAHVVSRVDQDTLVMTFPDGKEVKGRVVKIDEKVDLALIRVEGTERFPVVGIAPRNPASRSEVFTISNPHTDDEPFDVSVGTVVRVRQGEETNASEDGGAIILDIPEITTGSSGGAVVDSQGQLVGLLNAVHKDTANQAFALRADTISQFVAKYRESIRRK